MFHTTQPVHSCPVCGYCPHCGRQYSGPYYVPVHPLYPVAPNPNPWGGPWCGDTTTGGFSTITGGSTGIQSFQNTN